MYKLIYTLSACVILLTSGFNTPVFAANRKADRLAFAVPADVGQPCSYANLEAGPLVQLDRSGQIAVLDAESVHARGQEQARPAGAPVLDIALGQGDDRLLAYAPALRLDDPLVVAAVSDIRSGMWCGRPAAEVTGEKRRRAATILHVLAWTLLARGDLDEAGAWQPLRTAMLAWLPEPVRGQLVNAFSYRATLTARRDPLLAGFEPAKVSAFAYSAVGKGLALKDAGDMTDIDLLQRNGLLRPVIVGTQPIAGGDANVLGFWSSGQPALQAGQVLAPERRTLSWMQGAARYEAHLSLAPADTPTSGSGPTAAPSGFPGRARNGLVVFDATLYGSDRGEVLEGYRGWLLHRGFTLAKPRPVASLSRVLLDLLGEDVDYVVREGHADGDLVNAMSLTTRGLQIEAVGPDGERVTLLVPSGTKTPTPLPESAFAEAVRANVAKHSRPVTILDMSCWGLGKVEMHRAWLGPDVAVVVGSDTPVGFLAGDRASVSGNLLDAVRQGASFERTRAMLADADRNAPGGEDHFLLPDDPFWVGWPPVARPTLRIVERLRGRTSAYRPDGYY